MLHLLYECARLLPALLVELLVTQMRRLSWSTQVFTILLLALSPHRAGAQTDDIYGGPAILPRELLETYREAMRSDLRTLVTSQEAYFSDHNRYASIFTYGNQRGATIQPSPGVRLTLTYATARGWTARATHSLLPGRSCIIELGSVPPSRQLRTTGGLRIEEEGVPTCDAI